MVLYERRSNEVPILMTFDSSLKFFLLEYPLYGRASGLSVFHKQGILIFSGLLNTRGASYGFGNTISVSDRT